jgi:biopolymer transport protein ExbD
MAEMNVPDKGGGKGPKKMSTRVDLTPMVDLGFLLITFFMLTTTFNKPQAMEVNMPKKADKPEDKQEVKESKVLTLIMADNDKVYHYRGVTNPALDSTDFSAEGVRKVILKAQQDVKAQWGDEKELIVLLKSQRKAKFRNLVDVLDEMSITNTQRYAIVDYSNNDSLIVNNKIGK